MIEADTLAKLAEQCAPDIKLIFHRGLQAQSWAASYSPLARRHVHRSLAPGLDSKGPAVGRMRSRA
jgi:hypothetical protein